jgi:hypothetical protein
VRPEKALDFSRPELVRLTAAPAALNDPAGKTVNRNCWRNISTAPTTGRQGLISAVARCDTYQPLICFLASAAMGRATRNLLSIFVGVLFGGVGSLLVAIFWPLLFPSSLQGSSRGEDAVGIAFVVFYLSFALLGFLVCRRLTRKYIREDSGSTGRVLFR